MPHPFQTHWIVSGAITILATGLLALAGYVCLDASTDPGTIARSPRPMTAPQRPSPYLLPRLGYGEPDRKWAYWQPSLYGGGQLLHVSGLVWSGGYGVQRKVAGAEQALDTVGRIAGMGLMGLGGLIAIVGGVVFLVVAGRALLARRPA